MKRHNNVEDLWVSFNGKVFNLTPLVAEHPGELVRPLIQNAGTDISHWFDKAGEPKYYTDPVTLLRTPYCPQGRFVHLPPSDPTNDWDTSFGTPWWRDPRYVVGRLSSSTRTIRLKNVLTGQQHTLIVPSEETIAEIRERYLEYNWHGKSYVWKALMKENDEWNFVELDMEQTLEANGIPDESKTLAKLSVDQDFYIPVIHLYYEDDLTIA